MEEDILDQYCEIKAEIKDLQSRIENLNAFLQDPPLVSDTVTGSRKDLTIGVIKITGVPDPIYQRRKASRERYKKLLELKITELSELTVQVEEFINNMAQPELRVMFRLYYIDDLTWIQVAHKMNQMFPERKIKYTDENCWRKKQRFFKNVGSCRLKV